jgi:hypothetical protein
MLCDAVVRPNGRAFLAEVAATHAVDESKIITKKIADIKRKLNFLSISSQGIFRILIFIS